MRIKRLLALAAASIAVPASAAPRVLVDNVQVDEPSGGVIVDLVILNDSQRSYLPPRRLEGRIATAQGSSTAPIGCADSEIGPIPPGMFASLRCHMVLPSAIRIADVHRDLTVALFPGDVPSEGSAAMATPTDIHHAVPPALKSDVKSASPTGRNAFLRHISAYEPIYAVYGPARDSDARLQISLKYQLFGEAGAVGVGHPWENGIHLGFTQRLFWDLGTKSSPFRSIDFLPEIFYVMPPRSAGGAVMLSGQAGLRHESNGRDGPDSRSLNTVYVQPVATMPMGRYRLSVGPRLWLYAGRLKDNPDIKRYRGNTGLFAEIGEDDGLLLTTASRLNFTTGKGAVDATLSYPLDRIIESDLNLYVFGHGFAGYGENLLDYRRRTARLRLGIGIVR